MTVGRVEGLIFVVNQLYTKNDMKCKSATTGLPQIGLPEIL